MLQQINNLSQGDFTTFSLAHKFCPECFGEITSKDGETVCTQCGVVWKTEQFSNAIPFGESNTPTNLLAEGKGLGGTLQEKGTWCVLAHASSNQDMPLRARHTMIIMTKHEHPRLAALLRFGKSRCYEWGFADDKNTDRNVAMSNFFGDIVRTVGAYYVMKGLKFDTQHLADGCFALALRQVANEQYEEAKETLALSESYVNKIYMLYGVLKIEYDNRHAER